LYYILKAFENALEKAPVDGVGEGVGEGVDDEPPDEKTFVLVNGKGGYFLGFEAENLLILLDNPFLLFKLIFLL
jgi:hypothetical protein